MEYNNATLEGRWQYLITELLKKTIIKIKKNKHYLRPQLDVCNKKIQNKIELASDKI